METIAGSVMAGDEDGSLHSCKFNLPYTLCVDNRSKTCFVADTYNHKIRRFSLADVVEEKKADDAAF